MHQEQNYQDFLKWEGGEGRFLGHFLIVNEIGGFVPKFAI